MKVNKAEIAGAVKSITQGRRSRMKAMLGAIEDQFKGLALVCVDKARDTVIYGGSYVSEQERLYDESQLSGGLNGTERNTSEGDQRCEDKGEGI